jgi:hypothetical protein
VVYLTDPWYPGLVEPYEEPQELRGVYRYHPTTGELVREVNDMIQPNGIVAHRMAITCMLPISAIIKPGGFTSAPMVA